MNPFEGKAAGAPRRRMAWLDIVRGIALLAMASYHLLWDLATSGYLDAAFPSTGWPRIYARCIATTFLVLAGFSLVLAQGDAIRWRSFTMRLGKIVAAAALVSLATWFAIPEGFIFFGILHAIAAASLIGLLFLRLPLPLLPLAAAAAIAAPHLLTSDAFNEPWLWWLGLSTRTRTSFDYVPLLPWLGPFLIGMTVARLAPVKAWLRQKAQGKTSPGRLMAPFSFIGRHSLVFYLVHQPVLIAIVYAVSLVAPPGARGDDVTYQGSCEMSCAANQSAEFCQRFCGCTLERLQDLDMLAEFQSGAISIAEDERVKAIAAECTTMAQ
jgi:uncharacterized membrane protein